MFDAEKIWKSTTLPTLPAVAVRLLELARDPETEMTQIVDLIKTDPAIASRILQATNSAFFSFSSKVNSIDRAVPLLGTTVVTSLALSFSLASESINSGPLQEFYRSYWKQSIIHAAAGETIGKRCQAGLECEYFLAGLLVDIGRLAMLKAISREYYPVLVTSESQMRPLFEVEHEFLGLDHAQVACRLMEKWGLPENLLDGVRVQNFSIETLFEQLEPGTNSLEAAIVLANAVGDYFMSPVPGKSIQRIRQLAEHFFQMKGAEVDRFLQEVRQRVDDAGSLFAIDMSDISDPGEIMSQANQQLLELTMRAQSETLLASERQKQIEREKQQLESRNAELQQKATRDPLTGVFNRAHFDEALKTAAREASDRCSAICVMFLDIDKFKVLNDTYGHKFGDDVLKQFTKVVARSLRQSDVFCRYGGEEFVVIVHRPTEKGVEKLAERVRAAIEREDFLFEGKRVPVTSSFGTALGMPGRKDYNFGEQLLLQADEALYDSKKNGRNQVHHRCLMNSEERELIKSVNGLKFSRWLVSKEILDIPTVSRILLQVPPDQRSLGELAVDLKMLEPLDIEAIAEKQSQGANQRFGELAVETGLLTQTQLYLLLSFQIEPPDRLMNALTANGLFSAERSRELCNQFMKTIPAETIPVSIV